MKKKLLLTIIIVFAIIAISFSCRKEDGVLCIKCCGFSFLDSSLVVFIFGSTQIIEDFLPNPKKPLEGF